MLSTCVRKTTNWLNLIKIYFIFCLILCFLIIYNLITTKRREKILFGESEVNENYDKPVTIDEHFYFKLQSQCECRKETIFAEKLENSHRIWKGPKRNQNFYDTKVDFESITCDLYNAFRRGPNQKVIGISLYGTDDRYYKSLKVIAKQAAQHYPEWVMRIYYDNTIKKSVICEIECLKGDDGKPLDNIDFCYINNIPNGLPSKTWSCDYTHAMKWRWLPIGDPLVDTFLSRDSDSWFHDREYEAVKVWLKSQYLFHLMRGKSLLF
jgi:hypothetical protein